ncbi:hypothetical protein BGZ60DRAFT_429639 [Tricladium varicosporioides]|nr:hypothetical protein BGZ60DRAFT_429639 [Hymenoscyphus varicosporioides]
MLFKTIQLGLLTSLACAAAIPQLPTTEIVSRDLQAAAIILGVATKSGTCDGAQNLSECRTNVQAAQPLIDAFQKYGIYSTAEMAAVTALIAFESGDFKFNINHTPGRAGQGTRNMMMPNFVFKYAKSIPELATKVSAITLATSTAGLSDNILNQIRDLVLPDGYSFASGAWFLVTECASVRSEIQAGTTSGFTAFMKCVGVPDVTQARMDYWTRAVTAFKLN